MAGARAVTVTLGHAGLTIPVGHARSSVLGILTTHGADVLSIWHDGESVWTDEHGTTITEKSDAWLAIIPARSADHVRSSLAHLARKFGQDAIGYVAHDHDTYGPSYIPAEVTP